MGTNLPTSQTMAGMAPVEIRDHLRAMKRAVWRGEFIAYRGSWMHRDNFPRQIGKAAALEEAIERGLVSLDEERLELTDAGRGLAWSKSRRYPLATAQEQLRRFLDRVEAHNADPTNPFLVDQVWLFGSTLREEDTVGDIDLAYTTVLNPAYKDHKVYDQRRNEIFQAAPDSVDWMYALDWHLHKSIFGPRRHPLLAGAMQGLDTLIGLAVPCRILFDKAKGGRVDVPAVDKHPESTVRSESILPALEMPSFDPPETGVKLSDCRWTCEFRDNGYVGSPEEGAIFFLTEERQAEDRQLQGMKATDGRDGTLLCEIAGEPALAVGFSRAITHNGNRTVVTVRIDTVKILDEEFDEDLPELQAIGSVLADVAALDIRRAMYREIDQGKHPEVALRIEASDLESLDMYDVADSLRVRISHLQADLFPGEVSVEEPEWEVDMPWDAEDLAQPALPAP